MSLMFDDKLKLQVDILRERVGQFHNNIREQWELYEELRKKVNGLYEKDCHDTERPKVDILHDSIDNDIGEEIHDLRGRIIELEKKK